VHVVSDERVDRPDAVVTAALHTPLGARTWRWQGDIGADTCGRVGVVEWLVPTAPGAVVLDLALHVEGHLVTSRYTSHID
jgi:hypothetical protein